MKFIFDENFPKNFVVGFNQIQAADRHSKFQCDVVHVTDFMGRVGATDIEIIKHASRQEVVIVTHDSDFKKIKA